MIPAQLTTPNPSTHPLPGHLLSSTSPRSVALAHDWLVGYRGGEGVLEAIAHALATRGHPVPAIFTMFDDGRPLAPAIDALPHVRSSLGAMPFAGRLRRWMLPLYPRAVAQLSRRLAHLHAQRPVHALVSTSSAAIKGLSPPPGVPHICYCHSPARYLWNQASAYAGGDSGALRSLGLRLFSNRLRAWDRDTASTVTRFIANSSHTRDLVRRAFGVDALVIHPPVRTDFFTPPEPTREQYRDGWLYAGALEPYKRVDIAIRAAALARRPLTIVGDGSQRASLAALARSLDPSSRLISFQGRVDDDHLRDAYRSARVLLFPQIEDFGIVAVEAQACGTPVAATAAGGALDSVMHTRTGVHAEAQTPEALAEAARACEQLPDVSPAARAHAERFSLAAFQSAFLAEFDRVLALPAR